MLSHIIEIKRFKFIFLILLLSCTSREDEKIKIFTTEIIDMETKAYLGNIVDAAGNCLYLYGIGRPLTRIDLFKKKVDTLYFNQKEYIFGVKEMDDFVYFISRGSLKRIGGGLKDILKIGIDGYFKFINNDLILYEDISSMKNYFSIFNIKKGVKLNSFGDIIEYPDNKFKEKLKYDRFTIPYPEFEWDVKGSILIVYEYFFDRLKAYDVITGKTIKIFGVKHKNWTIPKIEITGRGKNRTYKIKKTPAAGITISNNYIFVSFEKYWLKDWEIEKYTDKLKKLYKKGFFFVDVYKKKDFEYVGTFYPLNDENFYQNGIHLRVWRIKAENDSTLTFYLQDNRKETFFRKVKVVFSINKP